MASTLTPIPAADAARHDRRVPDTDSRRLAIVDLAAFVVLALGIGLASAIALAATVLLLSGGGDVAPLVMQAASLRAGA